MVTLSVACGMADRLTEVMERTLDECLTPDQKAKVKAIQSQSAEERFGVWVPEHESRRHGEGMVKGYWRMSKGQH